MAASNGWTAWKVQTITTRHYERKIAVLETAIREIQRLKKEQDDELEESRKKADALEPQRDNARGSRLRPSKSYPGNYNSQ